MSGKALNHEQVRALDAVRAAHRVKMTVQADAEEEAAALIAKRVDAAARTESDAVRRALHLGVPRSRVGRDGLMSADSYRAVGRSLDVTKDDAAARDAAVEAMTADRFREVTDAEAAEFPEHDRSRLLFVDWPDFTPSPGSEAEQRHGEVFAILGIVQKRDDRRAPYRLQRDDRSAEFPGTFPPLMLAVEDPLFHIAADRYRATL